MKGPLLIFLISLFSFACFFSHENGRSEGWLCLFVFLLDIFVYICKYIYIYIFLEGKSLKGMLLLNIHPFLKFVLYFLKKVVLFYYLYSTYCLMIELEMAKIQKLII